MADETDKHLDNLYPEVQLEKRIAALEKHLELIDMRYGEEIVLLQDTVAKNTHDILTIIVNLHSVIDTQQAKLKSLMAINVPNLPDRQDEIYSKACLEMIAKESIGKPFTDLDGNRIGTVISTNVTDSGIEIKTHGAGETYQRITCGASETCQKITLPPNEDCALSRRCGCLHIPWPWPEYKYQNGTNDPCDYVVGCCICGATHKLDEFEKRADGLYRYGNRVIKNE